MILNNYRNILYVCSAANLRSGAFPTLSAAIAAANAQFTGPYLIIVEDPVIEPAAFTINNVNANVYFLPGASVTFNASDGITLTAFGSFSSANPMLPAVILNSTVANRIAVLIASGTLTDIGIQTRSTVIAQGRGTALEAIRINGSCALNGVIVDANFGAPTVGSGFGLNYLVGATVTLTNCQIRANIAALNVPGVTSFLIANNCIFESAFAVVQSRTVSNNGTITLNNCKLVGTAAVVIPLGSDGGVLYSNTAVSSVLNNCVVEATGCSAVCNVVATANVIQARNCSISSNQRAFDLVGGTATAVPVVNCTIEGIINGAWTFTPQVLVGSNVDA